MSARRSLTYASSFFAALLIRCLSSKAAPTCAPTHPLSFQDSVQAQKSQRKASALLAAMHWCKPHLQALLGRGRQHCGVVVQVPADLNLVMSRRSKSGEGVL